MQPKDPRDSTSSLRSDDTERENETGNGHSGARAGVANILASLMLPDTYSAVTSEKELTTLDVTKPDAKQWVCVHPTHEMPRVALIRMPEERGDGVYIVQMNILPHVPKREIEVASVHLAMASDGTPFIWPCRIGDDGWATSMRAAINLAKGEWIRMYSNRGAGKYETVTAKGQLPAPAWPKKTFAELVTLAFALKTIDSTEHPVLRVLRGEFSL